MLGARLVVVLLVLLVLRALRALDGRLIERVARARVARLDQHLLGVLEGGAVRRVGDGRVADELEDARRIFARGLGAGQPHVGVLRALCGVELLAHLERERRGAIAVLRCVLHEQAHRVGIERVLRARRAEQQRARGEAQHARIRRRFDVELHRRRHALAHRSALERGERARECGRGLHARHVHGRHVQRRQRLFRGGRVLRAVDVRGHRGRRRRADRHLVGRRVTRRRSHVNSAQRLGGSLARAIGGGFFVVVADVHVIARIYTGRRRGQRNAQSAARVGRRQRLRQVGQRRHRRRRLRRHLGDQGRRPDLRRCRR
jgi:hypothetical protein